MKASAIAPASAASVLLRFTWGVRGRHQLNLVPERDQLACPVVRRCTTLHADAARRELAEVIEHLSATKAHLRDPTPLGICRVDQKDLLGDVLLLKVDQHCGHYGTPMPGQGLSPINGRFRDECLNDTLFSTLVEARSAITAWKRKITTGTNPTRPSAT